MDKARAKAKEVVAAIQDACDITHGAATAWCPDEAEDLIAAALAALDGGEAVLPHMGADRHSTWQLPDGRVIVSADRARELHEAWSLYTHPPRSEVEEAVAAERAKLLRRAAKIMPEAFGANLVSGEEADALIRLLHKMADELSPAIRSTP